MPRGKTSRNVKHYRVGDQVDKSLLHAVRDATKSAFLELTRVHPEHFYYSALVTTGEALPPVVSAWSEEALERAVSGAKDKEDAKWGLKWSYAESPYLAFGEEFFEEVNRLWLSRPALWQLTDGERAAEFALRLDATESAIKELDEAGLFGLGEARNSIYVNVEVMPPDHSNVERARRLNPPAALKVWLVEAAEPDR